MRAYNLEVTGSLNVSGDIKAESYVIKNTTTHMTTSFASGSTRFGDTGDDRHEFTGSLFISASRIGFTNPSRNVFFGDETGDLVTGADNTFLGYRAGYSADTDGTNNGLQNVIIGSKAVGNNQGQYAEAFAMTGTVAIGYQVLKNGAGSSNSVVIGSQAADAVTTTDNLVIIGSGAGSAINSGDADGTVAIGYQALQDLTSGQYNNALGYRALADLTTGDYNIAIGHLTMEVHTTGVRNTAIGYAAMSNTDAGSTSSDSDDNIFIGYGAGSGAWTNAKSENNVAVGGFSMDSPLEGALYNTALGNYTLTALTTADESTAIGYNAGGSITTGVRNVTVGGIFR